MRHFFSFLIILILFGSCKSPKQPQSAKETVEAYLKAVNHFDYKSAEDFLVPNKENQLVLETLQKMEKSLPDERKKEFIDKEKNALYYEEKTTDSTTQITVTLSKGIAMPIEFNLKKVKDTWLIESIIQH